MLHQIYNDISTTKERFKKRQGFNCKSKTMEDITCLLQKNDEIGTTFVVDNLASLLPVEFHNIDVCALLSKMEKNRAETEILKKTVIAIEPQLNAQNVICEPLVKGTKPGLSCNMETINMSSGLDTGS